MAILKHPDIALSRRLLRRRPGTLANCDMRLHLENGQLFSPVADAAAPSTEIAGFGGGVVNRRKE